MTFNANVPNAAQSPGLFPPQNNTNNTRVRAIVNVDHIFSDSASVTQGFHKQVSMLTRVDPMALGSANGIFYTKVDVNNVSQIYWYNGVTVQQVSGYNDILPMKIIGSMSLAANAKADVLNVAYNFSGTGHAWFIDNSTSTFRWSACQFVRAGAFNNAALPEFGNNGSSSPIFGFSGGNVLQVQNKASGTQTIFWSCVINKNS